MDIFEFTKGESPLIISIPHAGAYIPEDIAKYMTDSALAVPDTDFYVDRLYGFAKDLGVNIIKANYSRYVIDLNRPPSNEQLYKNRRTTGLIPEKTFTGDNIYKDDFLLTENDIEARVKNYWQPYHDMLGKTIISLQEKFGHTILYDAHSIKSELPLLFEGRLADLNLGTANSTTCPQELERKIIDVMEKSPFSYAVNGRFIGGYITRNYSSAADNIYTLQMEISQKNYMEETSLYAYTEDKAKILQKTLKQIISSISNYFQHGDFAHEEQCCGNCHCQSDS